jgi:hypothetical protein
MSKTCILTIVAFMLCVGCSSNYIVMPEVDPALNVMLKHSKSGRSIGIHVYTPFDIIVLHTTCISVPTGTKAEGKYNPPRALSGCSSHHILSMMVDIDSPIYNVYIEYIDHSGARQVYHSDVIPVSKQ